MFFKKWKEKKERQRREDERRQRAGDQLITLYVDDEAHEFNVIYSDAKLRGKKYWIMAPISVDVCSEDNEALVFEVTELSDGELNYNIVIDDDIIAAVFDQYNEWYAEVNGVEY